MAEAAMRVLLEKERPGKVDVISSGRAAAEHFPATMYAIEAAKIWDADLSHHQSQYLTRELIDRSDLIFGMTRSHVNAVLKLRPNAKDKTFLFMSFPNTVGSGEDVADPIGQALDEYNKTFLQIGEHLGRNLDSIVQKIDEFYDGK
jgi:protein-tyrosine-phosphatase